MFREILLNLFSLRDIDSHYILMFFGLQVRIKHSYKEKAVILKEKGITDIPRDIPLIVSLTSFPQRINTSVKAVKTLLNQTIKPDKVILWLAESQFPGKEDDLPSELLQLKDFGLTIEWYEDIRSYKKLIPALEKYPNAVIITADDDVDYAADTVETLYSSYIKNPENIHTHRAARIRIKNNTMEDLPSRILYNKDFSKASFLNRLTGCAGVLYPPGCLSKEVFNKDFFMNKLATHDDIWFWASAVLNRTKVQVVKGYMESVRLIENSQEFALCKINRVSTTDEAYKILAENYPRILDILKEEER